MDVAEDKVIKNHYASEYIHNAYKHEKTCGVLKEDPSYGIQQQEFLTTLDEMVEQTFDAQCTGINPRYHLLSEIKQMYLNTYYGK